LSEVTSERDFSVLFQLTDGVIHLSSFYHFRVESFIKSVSPQFNIIRSKWACTSIFQDEWLLHEGITRRLSIANCFREIIHSWQKIDRNDNE